MPNENKTSRSIGNLTKFVADLLVEPVIFGYLLYLTFQRIQELTIGMGGDFWTRMGEDIENNMNEYIVFVIIFAIWVLYRAYKLREEKDQHNEIITLLKQIEHNTKR